MTPRVSLEAVSRVYRRPEGEVRALDGVTLRLEAGDFAAVTGPSGSGKSTLLHVLGLLETPTAGEYRLDGESVSALADADRALRRNRGIAFVFQAFQLVPHLTIADNVALPLAYRGVPRGERRARAARVLAAIGLERRVGHLPDELSGGEQQRAAVARALVAEPRLLLADEPTGNLDEASAGAVLDLFRAVHARGATVVVVTHNPRVAAAAARAYEIRDGRLR